MTASNLRLQLNWHRTDTWFSREPVSPWVWSGATPPSHSVLENVDLWTWAVELLLLASRFMNMKAHQMALYLPVYVAGILTSRTHPFSTMRERVRVRVRPPRLGSSPPCGTWTGPCSRPSFFFCAGGQNFQFVWQLVENNLKLSFDLIWIIVCTLELQMVRDVLRKISV